MDPHIARLWFESVDADSSGLLDSKELRQALDIGGLDYTLAQVHLFVRAFDSKGNAKLNINEFVELHRFLESVQDCFRTMCGGATTLSAAAVPQALARMGFSLGPEALRAVLTRFDVDGRGSFTVDTLLRMCLFLRTAVRAFQGFDKAQSGGMELTFNQFCYAAAFLA